MTLPTPESVLELARRRNVALFCAGDRLKFRGPATAVAELKPLFLEHKPALLAYLISEHVPFRGNEPWDRDVALRLLVDADALVERLGVGGRHTTVVDAAAMVESAFATRDLETVRFACAEFVATVRALARRG